MNGILGRVRARENSWWRGARGPAAPWAAGPRLLRPPETVCILVCTSQQGAATHFLLELPRGMPAASKEWSGVAELDPLLAERVEKHFCRLGDFLLSIADEDDALQMVKGCMEDVRSSTACRELAGKLWQFSQKHAGAADRVVRRVVRAATCGPYRPREAPEDVYLRAVNASPHLGLAVLEKAIKAKRATAGRAEHEEAKRKKWALLLAGYIEEAGLPAVERVRAMGEPNAVWLRAFGARRGNTLKNRCSSWAPVREWMLATHGSAWPRDAGALIQYLEERHQGAAFGKDGSQLDHGKPFLDGAGGSGSFGITPFEGLTS